MMDAAEGLGGGRNGNGNVTEPVRLCGCLWVRARKRETEENITGDKRRCFAKKRTTNDL